MDNYWRPGWGMIGAIEGLLVIALIVIVEWDKLRQSTIRYVLEIFVFVTGFWTICFAIIGVIAGLIIKDPAKIGFGQFGFPIVPLTRWLAPIIGLRINIDIYLKGGLINWVFLYAIWGLISGVISSGIVAPGEVVREKAKNTAKKNAI